MLDPRIYRAAFVPLLLAILVVAFSLESRPRAIGTTLAPDAFNGPGAFLALGQYAREYPLRRPGDRDDDRLAERVARDLRAVGPVRTFRDAAQTIDGERDITTVVATRPGRPGPGIVVVAHRDAAGSPAEAELSGTAVLAELARVASVGRQRRTITFVSTSGGSGGLAGAKEAVKHLPQPVDAVLVLGDMASRTVRKPWVVTTSNGGGSAPLRLSRTLEAAVRVETGQDAGGLRAGAQWARLAFPMTVGEQGAFGEAGLASVLLSATGELPPDAGAPVNEQRLTVFGRTALRTIVALDNGPSVAGPPESLVVTRRKILPGWAVSLLVGTAFLPVWLAVLDGLARVRRRRLPVAAAFRWTLVAALPFAVTALFTIVLGLTGLIAERPGAPVPVGTIPVDSTATGVAITLLLVFALGWIGLRPAALRLASARAAPGDAHGAAAVGVVGLVGLLLLVTNPYAAALLVLPAHALLVGVASEIALPRWLKWVLAVLSALPFLLVLRSLTGQLDYGIRDAAWSAVLMVAGGHVGPLAWLVWAVLLGAAVSALVVMAQRPPEEAPKLARGPKVRREEREQQRAHLAGTETSLGPGFSLRG